MLSTSAELKYVFLHDNVDYKGTKEIVKVKYSHIPNRTFALLRFKFNGAGPHLHIIHTVPQRFKGSVHHLPLASPLLHDAGESAASDQPGHAHGLLHVHCAPNSAGDAPRFTPVTVIVPFPHHTASLLGSAHHFLKNVHHVAVLGSVAVHHQHHAEAGEGDAADAAQALPQVVGVLLVSSDAKGHGASEVLAAGRASHPAVLQEGKEALQEEVEREEGTIEAKG